MGANFMMKRFNVKIAVTKKVGELLFDGYNDPFLTFVKTFKIPNTPPFTKFGWFVDRNGSWTYDGHFEMKSGQMNISNMGTMTNWNYVHKTKYYHDKCSEISGTSGSFNLLRILTVISYYDAK